MAAGLWEGGTAHVRPPTYAKAINNTTSFPHTSRVGAAIGNITDTQRGRTMEGKLKHDFIGNK